MPNSSSVSMFFLVYYGDYYKALFSKICQWDAAGIITVGPLSTEWGYLNIACNIPKKEGPHN